MVARISRPAKTAMQSGQAKARRWMLDYEPASAKTTEPLMGWTSTSDTQAQVRLFFETREEAIAYAERKGLEYRVIEPKEKTPKTVSYSENFKFGRVGTWTH
ncbi:ETC complex I subunit [Siculibacillus lacustris]|uniref:ETC complex I subunit n=1 Tax=Siculibacillus lacustris TaxID=1549641 RepID=A0A4Q9VFK7_9HYPH|nr:ETC complex I subunit [Siculibacillus lacustris]TBW33706.1 ETC complex I subunit [Siculibacillus lacustris]